MASMNPSDAARLSPAELRRRLLAPPGEQPEAAAVAVAPEPPPEAAPHHHPRQPNLTNGSGFLEPIAVEPVPARHFAPPVPPAPPPPPVAHGNGHYQAPGSRFGDAPVPDEVRHAGPDSGLRGHGGWAMPEEVTQLRSENAELRQLLAEMRQLLEEASTQEATWQERERQYQADLAEKARQNEELSEHLRQIEEEIANAPPPPKTSEELSEWADELERENARLTQERKAFEDEQRQLREDEEALEKQMRDMEVQMARERALMARQETELKRLSAEIQHELEAMQRGDGALRDRMQQFQRRHQEVLARSAGMPAPPPPPPVPAPPPLPAQQTQAMPAPHANGSGVFGRIFRGKK